MATYEELRAQLDDLNAKCIEIEATAEAESRKMTEDEQVKQTEMLDQCDELEKECRLRKRLEEQTARLQNIDKDDDLEARRRRKTTPDKPGGRVTHVKDRELDDPTWGFRHFGEFALAVVHHADDPNKPVDERIAKRATLSTYGNEALGSDGAFAVPPDFRASIMEKVTGEDSLVPRTDQLTSSTNNLTVPKDETTPWQTTGGILANWTGEAGAITQSKPKLESSTLRLHKLAVLVPITDELASDAGALNGWITRKAPQKISFELNRVIVQGTGAGQPLGILNATSTVSVAKVSSQDADTVVAQNIVSMYGRMYAPWRRNSVWLINQDIEPQLLTMALPGKDNTGTAVTTYGSHVYLPQGGLSQSPFATLMGRPVIPTQACETLGDKGDIIFAALDQYVTVTKTAGGLRQDTSMHLWFDQDTMAFRFIMRIAGQPWWSSTIASRDGDTTYSAFVTLDART